MKIKNIVLVHGGFVDGSGWEGVYKTLKRGGYSVAIVENPTISDKMIPPDAQRAMSKRAGATVVENEGSHAVYVSQPQAVAALIETAAKGGAAKAA